MNTGLATLWEIANLEGWYVVSRAQATSRGQRNAISSAMREGTEERSSVSDRETVFYRLRSEVFSHPVVRMPDFLRIFVRKQKMFVC